MAEPTLRQFAHFLAVLDQGSFTAAAKQTHISQSALSMAVSQLESILGAQLFIRHKSQRASPTPAALRLEPHARMLLEKLELAQVAVHDERHQLHGSIRVGCLATLSPRILPRLVRDLAAAHPRLALRLSESSPLELQERLRDGQLDVVFMYRRMVDEDLQRTDVAPARMHVMLPGSHRLAGARSVHAAELDDLPLVLLDIAPAGDAILGILTGLGLSPQPRLRSSNIETVREYVGLGLGYCLANTIPVNPDSFGGHPVSYVPLADDIPANAVSAVTLPGLEPSRRVQLAIDLVRRNLAPRD